MIRRQAADWLIACILFMVVVTGGMATGTWVRLPLGSEVVEWLDYAMQPGCQWMLFLSAFACLVIVFALLFRFGPTERAALPVAGLVFATLCAGKYMMGYELASRSKEPLTLITTMLIGVGIAAWLHSAAADQAGRAARMFRVQASLVAILAIASILHFDRDSIPFRFEGRIRARGGWDNPNIFGVVMGVGATMALALLLVQCDLARRDRRWHRFLAIGALVCAAALLLRGLALSLSRGAWAASAVGFAIVVCAAVRQRRAERVAVEDRPKGARRALLLGATGGCLLVGLSVFLVLTKNLMIVRRLASLSDVTDASWRNRLDAWEGACRMFAARPVAGYGWNRVSDVYRDFFRPEYLKDWAAITTNDYLTVACVLGGLGIAAFIWIIQTLLRNPFGEPARAFHRPDFSVCAEPKLTMGCALWAAGVVLVVAATFTSVIFNLTTGALLWFLLYSGSD